jgi:hypothetical protein
VVLVREKKEEIEKVCWFFLHSFWSHFTRFAWKQPFKE